MDFAVPVGTPVHAVADGVVARVDQAGVGKGIVNGNAVFLDTSSGLWAFLHLDQVFVTVGEEIVEGEEVGRSGNTGRTSGPHLHLALLRGGRYLDPWLVLEEGAAEEAHDETVEGPRLSMDPWPGHAAEEASAGPQETFWGWLASWFSTEPQGASWSSSVAGATLNGGAPGAAEAGLSVLRWAGGRAEVVVVEDRAHSFDGRTWRVL